MNIIKCSGAVVFTRINNEIKYLLVQQHGGFHGYPKGRMETGETEEQTAIREIYEEVGMRPTFIEGFKTIDEHDIPSKPDTRIQIVYFLAEYENQEIVMQTEELLSVKLLSFEEALNTFEYESSKRILKKANDFLTDK